MDFHSGFVAGDFGIPTQNRWVQPGEFDDGAIGCVSLIFFGKNPCVFDKGIVDISSHFI